MRLPVRSKRIQASVDERGEMHTDTGVIADTFAKFYEKLYQTCDEHRIFRGEAGVLVAQNSVPDITVEEVKAVLNKMAAGKASADDGIIAEMLKTQHEGLLLCQL